MAMELGTTNRINVNLTTFDAEYARIATHKTVIEAGRCLHTIRKRSEKVANGLDEAGTFDSESESSYYSDRGVWKNEDESFTKMHFDGETGYVIHVTAADDDIEVTIDIPTKRIVEHEDVTFEIRRQKRNKDGKIQTIGAVDTHSCRDLRELKNYVKGSSDYSQFNSVNWMDVEMLGGIVKELKDDEGELIEAILVTQV